MVLRLVDCLLVTSACAIALGCSSSKDASPTTSSAPTLLTEPLGELPSKLSAVGLYPQLPKLDTAPGAFGYTPGFPLWSDGGEKQRAIVLPEDTNIDDSDPDNYVFPLGALIFKTFSFKTPASPDQSVPVETRLLRLKDDGWELSAWLWDDAGQDADLLDLRRAQTRDVLADDGSVVAHSIPSRLECRQCHESSTSEVLGINELQLAQSGSLLKLKQLLLPTPSEPYRALPAQGPLTTSVLGYLVGNCVHCHNGTNGAASSFDMRPDVALANLVNQPTASSATADGIRIVPGKPEQSVLYLGVKAAGDLEVKPMPPLGVALPDPSAVRLLNDWITALGTEDDP